MESWLQVVCIEHNRHYLHIENQAMGKTRPYNVKDIVHEQPVELWNVDKNKRQPASATNIIHVQGLQPMNGTPLSTPNFG